LLALDCLAASGKFLRIKERPWPSVLGRLSVIIIVLKNSTRQVLGMADVETARKFAAQYIEIERH
jgi:hypothetical protein